MTHKSKPRRLYSFVENPQGLLKKYEQYRPSFEFHIYENNYKICAAANTRLQQQQKTPELTNDGLILHKYNETMKEFLEHVARGMIPHAIMEVLRDGNLQFYEGNLILQVYDHTNTVDVIIRDSKNQQQPIISPNKGQNHQEAPRTTIEPEKISDPRMKIENNGEVKREQSNLLGSPLQNEGEQLARNTDGTPSESKDSTASESNVGHDIKEKKVTYKRPRVYRTLLRPNELSQYYDMMSYADHSRFSDSIYQQFESEILTITKRNLCLDVPLNPYEHRDKLENDLFVGPTWDKEKKILMHFHREECTKKKTRSVLPHVPEHVDDEQKTSEYEQLMLIMNERTTTSTSAAFAAILTKNAMDKDKASASVTGDDDDDGDDGVGYSFRGAGGRNKDRSTTGNKVALAAATAAASLSGSNNDTNQFRRLKFIEQWKINKEKRRQQTLETKMLTTATIHVYP